MAKTAFNKYNAPELVALLFSVLESNGLDDTIEKLKRCRVPQVINEGWQMRNRLASRVASRFLSASQPLPFTTVPGKDAKLIEMAVSERMKWDWSDDPRSSQYKQALAEYGDDVFFKSHLPRAKQEFDDANEIIGEAAQRILQRLKRFQVSSLPFLEELGFTVKLGKFTSRPMGTWQDYTFYQEVAIKDNVFPTNSEITKFTWDFRGDVSVYDSTHWAQFRASKTPSPIFALIALAASQKIVARDWNNWVEWRRQKVAEKQQGGI